jgi:hypothetical protein
LPAREPLRRLFAPFFLTIILLLGCGDQALEESGRSYRLHKDFASLETISRCLTIGMTRGEIEKLLGKADYSPIEGQEYYSSGQQSDKGQTLVVEYRDEQGIVTRVLHSFWLGDVGE